MHTFVRLIERLTGNIGFVAAWVLAPLIIATVYEVLSRYLFSAPTIWAYELAYMATGTNYLLGMAFALRERSHIRIDVFYSRFAPKTRALIDSLGYLILFLPVTFWLSYRLGAYGLEAYFSGETSGESAWNPIIWPFRMVFFTGFAIFFLQGLAELIKAVHIIFNKPLVDTVE